MSWVETSVHLFHHLVVGPVVDRDIHTDFRLAKIGDVIEIAQEYPNTA